MTMPSLDTPIGEMRQVRVLFETGKPSEYAVHKDEVARFIEAQTQLHHTPGYNSCAPSKRTAPMALRITASPFRPFGPVWWSTPGLLPEDTDNGATLFDAAAGALIVWADPEFAQDQDIEIYSLEDAEAVWQKAA